MKDDKTAPTPTPATDEFGSRLLDTKQAARALGVSVRTLEDWRPLGRGPRFVKLAPRAVRYRPAELRAFVAAREASSTTEAQSRRAARAGRAAARTATAAPSAALRAARGKP